MKTVSLTFLVLLALVAVPPRVHGQEPVAGRDFKLLMQTGSKVPMKFGPAQLKTPARIKVRILTGTAPSIEGWFSRDNCKGMRPVTDESTLLLFKHELKLATEVWSQVANIEFEYADSDEKADVLFGFQGEPDEYAYANVRFVESVEGKVRTITKGLVCLNPLKRFTDKPGFEDGRTCPCHTAYTFAHELGHAIGLDHPGSSDPPSLMSYRFPQKSYTALTLSKSDVAGARYLYGKRKNYPPMKRRHRRVLSEKNHFRLYRSLIISRMVSPTVPGGTSKKFEYEIAGSSTFRAVPSKSNILYPSATSAE